jgi:hypothetical protein
MSRPISNTLATQLDIALQKTFGEDAAHIIQMYYYGLQHRQKIQKLHLLDRLKFFIFYRDEWTLPRIDGSMTMNNDGSGNYNLHYSIVDFDPVFACEYYNQCNCCPRHQRNKGAIINANGELQTIIWTSHTLFNPNWRFDGRINLDTLRSIKSHRLFGNYEEQDQNQKCFCNCRMKSRQCVRNILENKHGKQWVNLFHNAYSLGIGPTNLTVGALTQVEYFDEQLVEAPDNADELMQEDEEHFYGVDDDAPWENNSVESYESD